MSNSLPLSTTRLLLVEGKDDKEFFDGIGTYLNIRDRFHIAEYEGKNNLDNALLRVLGESVFPQITHISIVRDADFRPGSFNSVQSALDYANRNSPSPKRHYPIPDTHTLFFGEHPQVAVLILPAPNLFGMLEDVVLTALDNDPISSCVNDYIQCLQQSGIDPVQERLSKTKMRIFIEGKHLDKEISTGNDRRRTYLSDIYSMSWWTWDHPAFDSVKAFIQQIASE
ncbi:MAG: hypothetical protein H6671_08065 [Anaerolineaceae bacterium]|nr:hypothetical protein [Anaerolineaceae bacterium]